MIPKAFSDFFQICDQTILALEECIKTAQSCEKSCAVNGYCQADAQGFTEAANHCITQCEECVKACNALLQEFTQEGHNEHKESLDKCVKALGDCITTCQASIDNCGDLSKCRIACREALDACNNAIQACDECYESCEKHSVFYEQPKK